MKFHGDGAAWDINLKIKRKSPNLKQCGFAKFAWCTTERLPLLILKAINGGIRFTVLTSIVSVPLPTWVCPLRDLRKQKRLLLECECICPTPELLL